MKLIHQYDSDLSLVMKTITTITTIFLISVTVSQPHNRHQHSRELAELAAENPGSSLEILREIRRNIRASQASLKLVISMERELQRVARHITVSVEPRGDDVQPPQQRDEQDNSQLPFSSWAG